LPYHNALPNYKSGENETPNQREARYIYNRENKHIRLQIA